MRHSSSVASSSSSSFFPTTAFSGTRSPPLPPAPLWYTARPSLNSTLQTLDDAHTKARTHLFHSGLLPSVDAALSSVANANMAAVLPHPRAKRWKPLKDMSAFVKHGHDLKSSQYKRLVATLSDLEALLPYAHVADSLNDGDAPSLRSQHSDGLQQSSTEHLLPPSDVRSLRDQLEGLLARFEQPPLISSTGVAVTRKAGKFRQLATVDALGRVLAVGKRKESSARVWLAPVTDMQQDIGRVLVNAQPVSVYFADHTHHIAAVKPLALTESLGAFNLFAIARGGGLAAQADAVAMGAARALIEWQTLRVRHGLAAADMVERWREILKRAGLVERDPRMVERKKTGQVKARKKFTWVKR
ncbi:37S ribosomal protein S9, mitochondrial [Microbotryomycetes sp. JL201]|nr:37S ribosomal protein S9, mitochondrial [Microbotryomycetes sp. JL201]